MTVKGPSHLPYRPRNTLTKSPGSIGYIVAGANFGRSARLIRDYATIVSISVLASLSAPKISIWFWLILVNPGDLDNTANNKSDENNPFGPIVSLIDLIAIHSIILSDSL